MIDSWVHDTESARLQTSGDGVPEGIFYPQKTRISPFDVEASKAWKEEALEAGRASWRVIGDRQVQIVRKWINPTLHAIRTKARGYGKRRKHWNVTTECGQILYEGQGWQWEAGTLRSTTCLSCRKLVRERYEHELQHLMDVPDWVYDEYERIRIEEMWRVQAEWHQPDPVIANWVGEAVPV